MFGYFCGTDTNFALLNDEQLVIFQQVSEYFNTMFPQFANQISPRPILLLILGIFGLGSVIGLVKRLIR